MEKAITFEQVQFSYQDFPILENVTFAVEEGEFIGVFGPNGGGKTTLLRLIMGFLGPSSGKIKIFGEPPTSIQELIGYVPQNLRFDRQFPITVLDVVLLGRLSHLPWHGNYLPEDKEIALDMIEKMGLTEHKNKAFGTLSGGQAQRALIARGLVSNPQILLLDEPTASVDIDAELEIYEILNELKGKITIMMVTHHLGGAIDQVDRVLCVNKNVIALQPEEVCEHFAMGLYHPPLINKEPQKTSC